MAIVLLVVLLLPAVFLLRFLFKNHTGHEEPKKAIFAAFGFGLLALVITLIFSFVADIFIKEDFLDFVPGKSSIPGTALSVFVFAFIEEISKFIPLFLFVYTKKYFDEYTDGIIYFVIVGLTFLVIETLLYSFTGGVGTVIGRYAMAMYLHAGTTSIVGYSLIKYKLNKNYPFINVLLMLLVATLLHTVYNFGLVLVRIAPILGIVSVIASFISTSSIFWLYYKATLLDRNRHLNANNPTNPGSINGAMLQHH